MHLPRHAEIWLPGLLAARRRREAPDPRQPIDVMFCIADHFEPAHGNPGPGVERARVAAWTQQLPALANHVRDADGRPPQHTFFFPAEAYRPEHIDALGGLCEAGLAELEIHLHHDNDTSEGVRSTLRGFADCLAREHGFLGRRTDGRPAYGFIHGNWALDNARPDGKYCGVNDELSVLRETGCYADFTQPAAPDVSQTRTVNSLYYAVDDPRKPRSHERGLAVTVGQRPPHDGLLIVQGPLSLDWDRRIVGVLPGLDVAAIDASRGYTPSLRRFRMWVDAAIAVRGQPNWLFVKVHTHGAPERNAATLLGAEMRAFHQAIGQSYNDGERFRLHYVTARELANIIKAAESGARGNPRDFRDYAIRPPALALIRDKTRTG